MLQATGGLVARGRVRGGADDPGRPVAAVADGGRAGQQPPVVPVAVLDAMLEVELVRGAVDERVQRLRERRAVVWMDAAEPLPARLADLPLAVAEQGLPLRGVEDAVVLDVMNAAISAGMSSRRSRRGGTTMVTTFSR